MPAQNVALTAACVDATNGIVSVDWSASVGFYFSADPGAGILGPNGSGKSTIVQLMYSPDDVKDDILPSGAGAVNDVVWDATIITENGDGITEWAQMLSRVSTVRAWTNGYVYGLIFQDDNVEPGDWYFFSSPLLALEKKQVEDAPQDLEINTPDAVTYFTGDPIDGGPNNAQVIDGALLTVNNGSGSGWYTNGQQVAISADVPASGKVFDRWTGDTAYVNNVTYTNALVTLSNNAVSLTATYKEMPMPPPNTFLLWLASYGLTNYDTDAVADQDSDGLAAWQEYIAGTVPTNAASVLKAAQATRNVITWTAQSNRIYSVYWSTNLVQGFTMKQDNILYPTNSFTNANPDSRLNHYQIKVRMQ
jgi:hypothetical protein